ncbi:MAG: hypothetical protein AAGC85_18820, partial [Bacteroidota bacterium]
MLQLGNNSNLLSLDGTSRSERSLRALQPNFIAVDEREMRDLLVFVYRFARQINFIKPAHLTEGIEREDWQSFFERSAPIQVARISYFDVEAKGEEIRTLIQNTRNRLSRTDLFKALDALLAVIQQINNWYISLDKKVAFKLEIANYIRSNLGKAYQRWASLEKAAEPLGYGQNAHKLDSIWTENRPFITNEISFRGNIETQILVIINRVEE